MFKKTTSFYIFVFIISSTVSLVADDIKNNPFYHAAQAYIKRSSCDDVESCKKMFTVKNLDESQENTRDNKIIQEFFAQVRAGNTDANSALDYCRVELSKKITALSNTAAPSTWGERLHIVIPVITGIAALACAVQSESISAGLLALPSLGYGAYKLGQSEVKKIKDEGICHQAQYQIKQHIHLLNIQQIVPSPQNSPQKN